MARSSLAYIPGFSVNFFFQPIFFSNSSHLEWRAELSDTTLKGNHPGTIPARFGLIWFSGFREDLNAIFYQNMPNLHNRYISAERKNSPKLNQTWQGWSLGGSLSKLCSTAPPSIQDGCCY
jgi:hypothetical protein